MILERIHTSGEPAPLQLCILCGGIVQTPGSPQEPNKPYQRGTKVVTITATHGEAFASYAFASYAPKTLPEDVKECRG